MALIAIHLECLRRIRETTFKDRTDLRVLSLGYPDILVPDSMFPMLLGKEAAAKLTYRDDYESILRWHKLEGKLTRVAETNSLFAALGLKVDYVDISPSRGFERKVDLNEPLPEDMRGQYDIVLDLGTIEHCFNVAQATMNISLALKPGGAVLHSNPMSHFNHGFYNFSPTFYKDFYEQNGGSVQHMIGVSAPNPLQYQIFQISNDLNFTPMPIRGYLLVIAQRGANSELHWPTQGKYLKNPDLKN